jgi:ATP-dependent Clp protease ATP-binding subunit ClpB
MPLTKAEVREIATLQIGHLQRKVEKNGMKLELTPEAIDWLTNIGFDIQYGARHLKRAVQKYIADPLAVKLLSSEFVAGDNIMVETTDNGGFVFQKK